jgi:hypothetical protein
VEGEHTRATCAAIERDVNDTPQHDGRADGEPTVDSERLEAPLRDGVRHGRFARWMRLARLVAPPLLAAAAIGLHFRLNVPDEEVLEAARAQQRKPPKKKTPPKKVEAESFEPRSDAQLARAVRRFERVEFDDEPVVAAWARRHQNLVNKAVVVARKHAFEGAPEDPRVIVTGTRCRTVRCRFLLRSPYPHELDLLDETVQRLHAEGKPLWRAHDSQRVDPPRGAPPGDTYLQVTVAFTADEPDGRTIEVAPADEDLADEDKDESEG